LFKRQHTSCGQPIQNLDYFGDREDGQFAQPPVHVHQEGTYQYQGVQWFNTSPEEPHETPVLEFNDKGR
jgi:hypothetical protein